MKELITCNAEVVNIEGSETGVTATWLDSNCGTEEKTASADYCICTIPFSILGQIENNLSSDMTAIDDVYYAASIEIGLEFKRRFGELDDGIFGGFTYTNLPITLISYPSTNFSSDGAGVLLATCSWDAAAYQFSSIPPAERIERALEFGSQIDRQYREAFSNGVSVVWHRVPWTLGCYAIWRKQEEYYPIATQMDQRMLMAGEHFSYLPAWQAMPIWKRPITPSI